MKWFQSISFLKASQLTCHNVIEDHSSPQRQSHIAEKAPKPQCLQQCILLLKVLNVPKDAYVTGLVPAFSAMRRGEPFRRWDNREKKLGH